jgi:hypothetical protein
VEPEAETALPRRRTGGLTTQQRAYIQELSNS